jgi:uncharacterized protein YkwD
MLFTKSKKSKAKSNKKRSKPKKFLQRSGRSKFIAFLSIALFASVGGAIILHSSAAVLDNAAADTQYNRLAIFRAQNGRGALFRSKCLSESAQEWANHMADANSSNHWNPQTSPTGPTNLIHSNAVAMEVGHCGGTWGGELQGVAENIGITTNSSDSMFDAFINSEHHRANMLDPVDTSTGTPIRIILNKVGIGAARDKWGNLWVVQQFAKASGADYDKPYSYITGSLDSANCNRVTGWALNRQNVKGPIAVHIYFSNGSERQGIVYNGTNVYRPDVNARFVGATGNHGFNLGVPLNWQGKNFMVQAYGIDNGSNPLVGQTLVPCGGNRFLDSSTTTSISGWAFDRNNTAAKLDIWANVSINCKDYAQYHLGQTNISRPSVDAANGLTNGVPHGFQFKIPGGGYGKPHCTQVFARNSSGDQMRVEGNTAKTRWGGLTY